MKLAVLHAVGLGFESLVAHSLGFHNGFRGRSNHGIKFCIWFTIVTWQTNPLGSFWQSQPQWQTLFNISKVEAVSSSNSSSVIGPPTITDDFIDRVLSINGSPAAGTRQAWMTMGWPQDLTTCMPWRSSYTKTPLARRVSVRPIIRWAIFGVLLALPVSQAFAPTPPGKKATMIGTGSCCRAMCRDRSRSRLLGIAVVPSSKSFPSMRPCLMAIT